MARYVLTVVVGLILVGSVWAQSWTLTLPPAQAAEIIEAVAQKWQYKVMLDNGKPNQVSKEQFVGEVIKGFLVGIYAEHKANEAKKMFSQIVVTTEPTSSKD